MQRWWHTLRAYLEPEQGSLVLIPFRFGAVVAACALNSRGPTPDFIRLVRILNQGQICGDIRFILEAQGKDRGAVLPPNLESLYVVCPQVVIIGGPRLLQIRMQVSLYGSHILEQ